MGEIKKYNIDEEIERYDSLVHKQADMAKIGHEFDENLKLLNKIHNQEWLDEKELEFLDLNPEFIKEYTDARQRLEKEEKISDEERAAEYISKLNDQIELGSEKFIELEKEREAFTRLQGLMERIVEYTNKLAEAEGVSIVHPENFLSELTRDFNTSVDYGDDRFNSALKKVLKSRDFKNVEDRKEQYKEIPELAKQTFIERKVTPDEILEKISKYEQIVKDKYDREIQQLREKKERELEDLNFKERNSDLTEYEAKQLSALKKFFNKE